MTNNRKFCEWKPEMSVGSEELDYQHKHLVELINQVYHAHSLGNQRKVIGPILDKLAIYTSYHFSFEEVYFELFNYPEKTEHIKEHDEFRKMINEFTSQYKSRKSDVTPELLNFLKEWLRHHVLGSDRRYIDCFTKNGVK